MHEVVARSGKKDEFTFWKSQIVTSKADKKGLRRNPYAFTEQGVAMLSGVLNSDAAIDVNIKIMRAFVAIRRLTSLPYTVNRIEIIEKEIQRLKADFDDTLANQNDINEDTRAQLDAISIALAELQSKEPAKEERKPIGFIRPKDK